MIYLVKNPFDLVKHLQRFKISVKIRTILRQSFSPDYPRPYTRIPLILPCWRTKGVTNIGIVGNSDKCGVCHIRYEISGLIL